MDCINKLFESIKAEDIKSNLKNVISEIEKKNREEQNQILNEIVEIAKIKREEINKEREINKGVFFYNETIAPFALLVNEIVMDMENNEDILETLKFIQNNYFKNFKKPMKDDWFLSKKDIGQLLGILELECKFFSMLEKQNIKLSIYSFDFLYKNMEAEQTNYNQIRNNEFAIKLFHSKAKNINGDNEIEIFLQQFGVILKHILVGSSKKAPDDFFDVFQPVKELPYIDKESKEYTALFADTFTHYIIEKMEIKVKEELGENWKPKQAGRNEEFVKNMMQYFDNIFKELLKDGEEEWGDEEKCPCGSNKKYKNCCKKKKIKYYKDDDEHYIKSIPVHPELKSIFYEEAVKFKLLFGRTPGEDDYIAGGVLRKDITRFRKKLKRENIVNRAWLYASEQMDGLMPTEDNLDLLSERDLNEFKGYIEEYEKLMKSKIKAKTCNSLQAAEIINMLLEKLMTKMDDMIYVLNLFVNSYSKEKANKEVFIIENIKDFLVFCAYKTSIHMTTLEQLIDNQYYDTSMAVVRFIYEILIQIRAYKNDNKLFEEKILSLAGLESGKCVRENNKIIKNLETGAVYHYQTQKKQLAEMAGKNYSKIYELLYQELSEFIHLDAIGAKKIFQENDMFLDIDECLMAGFISMVFCIQIIMELIEFEGNNEKISKDIKYFSNTILKELLDIFPTIITLEDKEVYKILENTLKEYKTDYKINYQRQMNCEIF